jgi:hypothetical protein
VLRCTCAHLSAQFISAVLSVVFGMSVFRYKQRVQNDLQEEHKRQTERTAALGEEKAAAIKDKTDFIAFLVHVRCASALATCALLCCRRHFCPDPPVRS